MTAALSYFGYFADGRRAMWFVFAAVLVLLGFAADGATEVGHHLGFIAGGFAVGWGARR